MNAQGSEVFITKKMKILIDIIVFLLILIGVVYAANHDAKAYAKDLYKCEEFFETYSPQAYKIYLSTPYKIGDNIEIDYSIYEVKNNSRKINNLYDLNISSILLK